MSSTDRLAYRPAEAADVLGISRGQIYVLLRNGTLSSTKVGGVRLIPRGALLALVTPA